jgi:hypothetical protein
LLTAAATTLLAATLFVAAATTALAFSILLHCSFLPVFE